MPFSNYSIKRRLLLPLLAALTVALSLVAIEHTMRFRSDLTYRLRERAEHIGGLIQFMGSSATERLELQHIVGALGEESEVKWIFVVAGKPARVVASSQAAMMGKSLNELADPEDQVHLREALTGEIASYCFNKRDKDFAYFRAVPVRLDGSASNAGEQGAVMVCLEMRYFHQQVVHATAKGVAGSVGTVLLLAVFGWLLLRRHVLRPISRIGGAMTGCHAEDGHRPIDGAQFSGELAQLARAWNALVDRLQRGHAERAEAEEAVRRARDELEVRVAERTLELSQSNETLQMQGHVIECMTEAVMVCDSEGSIVTTNPAADTMFGYDPAELIGRPVSILRNLENAESQRVVAEVMASLSTGMNWSGEIQRRKKDGTPFLVRAQIKAFQLAGRRHFFAVQQDITESKQAAEALQRHQAELRVLFDLIPAMIWFKDTKNGTIRANRRAADAAGKSVEEMEGHSMYETLPDEAAKYYADDLEVIRSGNPKLGVMEPLRDKNGRAIWLRTDRVPYCNQEGQVIGIVVVAEDVTERRQAEQLLAQFAAVMEATPDFVGIADAEGRVLYVNRAGRRMTGFAELEDISATTIADFVATAELPRVMQESIPTAIRDGVWSGETVFMDRAGGEIPLSQVIVTHKAPDGRLEFTATTGQDLRERKKGEATLEEANRQLREVSRQAGMAEVATSVLHNVGNVLNSVNVSCSVISEKVSKSRIRSVGKAADLLVGHADNLGAFFATDPTGQKMPEYLGKLALRLGEEQTAILGELESLSRNIEHIKDIIDVQQTYAKNLGGVRETMGLEGLMEDALRMNAGALLRHRVEVIRQYQQAPPVPLEKHKVLQILVNLVRNAKHALTDSGREDKRLIVRIAREDGEVAVSVSDNGIGIPAENITRIFAHGFTTKKGGHGFGLHSGVLAAQEMGGSLEVRSEGRGTGATFRLALPLGTP